MRFRSLKKGDGKLTLINVRPWEQPEHPQETFMLTITVEQRIRSTKAEFAGRANGCIPVIPERWSLVFVTN